MIKYSNFLTKILCMILVMAALGSYQVRTSQKAQEEAQNEAAEAEAYNREIRRQMEGAQSASPYTDGTWEGSADGFGGPIRVEVTIEGGDLTDIRVLSADGEDPAYYSQAEAVIPQILSSQGVEVDTVTGATFSSRGLIGAVTEALRKAVTE